MLCIVFHESAWRLVPSPSKSVLSSIEHPSTSVNGVDQKNADAVISGLASCHELD